MPIRIRPAMGFGDEALFDLCRRNRPLRIERTADGDLVVRAATDGETGRRAFDLIGQLGIWVERDGTGIGFGSTGFLLANRAERSPDAAWIRNERWDAVPPDARRRFVPLCPDFVIEIRSPSDTRSEVQEKMAEWITNGVRLGWLLDPDARAAWAYRPGRAPEALGWPDELAGDPELAGLRVDLRRLA